MTKVQVSEVRDNLADILNRTAYGKERVIIERRGKPLAALVSMDDMELLRQIESAMDIADALAALREAEETGKTVEWADLKRELR